MKLSIENWKTVEEHGMPEDMDWCFVAWKDSKGDIEWSTGGYSEDEKQFYANYGLGGLVLDEKNVIAWCSFDDVVFEK